MAFGVLLPRAVKILVVTLRPLSRKKKAVCSATILYLSPTAAIAS